MNTNFPVQTPPERHEHRGQIILFGITLFFGLLLIVAAAMEVGMDYHKIKEQVKDYFEGAGAMIGLVVIIAALHKAGVKNFYNGMVQRLISALYVAAILILLLGVFNYTYSFMHFFENKPKQTAKIIDHVKAKTLDYKETIPASLIYKDCRNAGVRVKRFERDMLDSLFKEDKIPEKDQQILRFKVDSALAFIVNDMNAQCNLFTQFTRDLTTLVQTGNSKGIDQVFEKYNIPMTAKRLTMVNGTPIANGLFRNYLEDVMQTLIDPWKEIVPPPYKNGEFIIEDIVII